MQRHQDSQGETQARRYTIRHKGTKKARNILEEAPTNAAEDSRKPGGQGSRALHSLRNRTITCLLSPHLSTEIQLQTAQDAKILAAGLVLPSSVHTARPAVATAAAATVLPVLKTTLEAVPEAKLALRTKDTAAMCRWR